MRLVFQAFVDRLIESRNSEDLRKAMAETAASLDLCCFAYLSLYGTPSNPPTLISSYPSGWTSHYLQKQYERVDPVIIQALRHPAPFSWGLGIGPSASSESERELFDEAARFGIRCGFTIPIHDSRGAIAAVTFAADERRSLFERTINKHVEVLQLMAIYFHAHARRRTVPDNHLDGIALSPREVQCLRWASEGKSAWETGQIMGISHHTVAFHLENARAKLGVRSTIQAVARLASTRSGI